MDMELREDDDFLVRVKAQVMTRDESTGGWVPLGRGGMSIVGLRQIVASTGDDLTLEYVLHGQRIADQSEVLSCVLNKDLQYTRANPTFHHWWTGARRYGLTFQSSADARLLERSVRNAVENMLTPPDCSTLDSQITDDDVFVALSMPQKRADDDSCSQSASTISSLAANSLSPPCDPLVDSPDSPSECPETPSVLESTGNPFFPPSCDDRLSSSRLYHVRYVLGPTNSPRDSLRQGTRPSGTNQCSIEMLDYTYVQLSRTKSGATSPTASQLDYNYPSLEVIQRISTPPRPSPPTRMCYVSLTGGGGRKRTSVEVETVTLPAPMKSRSKRRDWLGRKVPPVGRRLISRARCVHCQEVFDCDENVRGSCKDAPDLLRTSVEHISCLCCARAMLYHCTTGDDGEPFEADPCAGDCLRDRRACKRWTALAVLSLVVPCLCCYLPLRACHRCGMRCGCCGGKHKADYSDDD